MKETIPLWELGGLDTNTPRLRTIIYIIFTDIVSHTSNAYNNGLMLI